MFLIKINYVDIFELIWFHGCRWGEGMTNNMDFRGYLHPIYNPDMKFIQKYQDTLFSSTIRANTLGNHFLSSQFSHVWKSIIICKVHEKLKNEIFRIFMNFTYDDEF